MIYVNDIAIISLLKGLVNKLKRQLAKKFEIENNSLIRSFLRLKVT